MGTMYERHEVYTGEKNDGRSRKSGRSGKKQCEPVRKREIRDYERGDRTVVLGAAL